MGYNSRQWICFCLFRFLLPVTQLAAAVLRFSGFSLLYGCLALLTPLLRRPTCASIQRYTGLYLVVALVLCTLTMLSQVTFQVYFAIAKPATNNDSILAPCSSLERTLRQIGLQGVPNNDPLNAIRIVLPDIGVFIITLLVFICCRILLRPSSCPAPASAADEPSTSRAATTANVTPSTPERRRLFTYGVMVADFAGNFLVVMTMGACGIALPSVINAVYFVVFIGVVTLWSCCFRLGRWFSIVSFLLLAYVAAHLIVIHLTQFEFMQDVWPDTGNSSHSLVERILGLPQFVTVDCTRPWAIMLLPDIRWTAYLDVALLLFFYFMLAFEIRRRLEPTTRATHPSTNAPEQYVNPVAAVLPETEGHAYDTPHAHSEKQFDQTSNWSKLNGLIEGPTNVPNYHSLDPVDDEPGTSELPDVTGEQSCHHRDSRSSGPGSSKGAAAVLFQLIAYQSYIGTLIVMMAWSVVFHTWLTFVLLIAACFIWIVPKKRMLCLRVSPLIVFYAVCLITLQYIYGFDLTDSELPVEVAGYQLSEIGLVKYPYPAVGWLAIQIAFTLIFWLTLRQFTWECSTRRRGSQLEAESLETLNEADGTRRKHKERLSTRLLKIVGDWLHGMLCKYWIIVCAALFLLLAMQTPNVYRILYMVLFLCFVVSFHLSYALWRFCIKFFWTVVIIYSMVVLLWIYVFQFRNILAMWQNSTGMSDSQVADLGLERYDTSQLLVQLLTPTSFLIFIILHLHYFQRTFLQMSDVDRYRYVDESQFHVDSDAVGETTAETELQASLKSLWHQMVGWYCDVTTLLWRLAEIHIHKIVMLAIFVLCTREVCALNVVFVVILVVLMPFTRCYNVMSHICQIYASVVIIAKMLYQLNMMSSDFATSNCTSMKNMNSTISGIPPPFNETIHTATYVGFVKVTDLSHYIKNYVVIVLLMAFEAIVRVHQQQHYAHPQHERPPTGIVFPGISRADADRDLIHCAKFFVNYAFYKFGREICFIMTVITMVVRLDMYSVIYGVFLGILVLLSRRCCYRLWSTYIVILMVLLIIQYLSCVGAPIALCWEYPWNLLFKDDITYDNLKIFLYLPNFNHPPPYAGKLIADFFQLLFACLQWHVFSSEKQDESDEGGGCNRSIINGVNANKPNPREDFVTYKDSYLDYVKVIVFYFSFWLTLLIVFITGTSRISLFCLGYLMGSFFILWFGQDLLLKPTRALLRTWYVFMMYSYLVILMKCCLQLVGCVYIESVTCTVRQLFSITCIQSTSYISPNDHDKNCLLDEDDAGLAWDAVSFTFLLAMTRVYKTWYFQHIVTDLRVDNLLSSRGGQIINESLFHRVIWRKAQESAVVNKIKRKMERIRLRHYRLGQETESEPTDHYAVIRSGDYYMFEDLSDDELDVQTEVSDEPVDQITFDDDPKKPGPLQLINAGITSGAKGALELWHRQSSADSMEQDEQAGGTVEDEDRLATVDEQQSSEDLTERGLTTEQQESHDKPAEPIPSGSADLVAAEDQLIKDKKEPVTTGVANIFMVAWVVLCALLEKLVAFLNRLSSEYREVSYQLAKDKEQEKARQTVCGTGSVHGSSRTDMEHRREPTPPARPHSIALKLEEQRQCGAPGPTAEQQQAEKQFESTMPLPLRVIKAAFEVLLCHSDLLCYFAMVLNALVTGSLLSIVYPVLAFLWAMLSSPRPSKAFWVFAITYTEVLIVIKYLFQFNFYDWNKPNSELAKEYALSVFNPIFIFGLEKKDAYAAYDLFLLFSLFIHRSILKQHGLWKDAIDISADLEKAKNVVVSRQNTPAATPKDPSKLGHFHEGNDSGDDDEDVECHVVVDNQSDQHSSPHDSRDGVCEQEDTSKPSSGCGSSCLRIVRDFYQSITNPKFSAATDVYAWMFVCDLITFIIVVFGYASFGPSEAAGAGEVVASVIQQNRVPAPFLGMLLAQFILIIIDRALYLRKQIFGKFLFQIMLVFLVHAWMFFGLPHITKKRFVNNSVAQLWYFTKCVYFAFSAYQIRCGYPTRILGNFLTKKYNYLNLFAFKGFLVIPFLLELRALMDWMFTDTTLALTSWLQMEDIFSNVFCIKCDRHGEKTFPLQRGLKRRAIIKYGMGGLLLFLLIFIIWFPLLLFSLSATIFIPNRPIDVTVNIKIWGYQTIFTMSAQQQWIRPYSEEEYSDLRKRINEPRGQSFLAPYHTEDVYWSFIDGTSGSTWDISPPNNNRLIEELKSNSNVSIYFTVSFTREPSPGLQTETVTGPSVRVLYRQNATDNMTMYSLARMLEDGHNSTLAVPISHLYPRYWMVPASGKPSPAHDLETVPDFSGNVELQLHTEATSNARWWTVNEAVNGTKASSNLSLTSFNQRIAPSSMLSMATSYGVIGLYVSLVLVVGQFVRMWVQGLSFRIMFVELPNPDLLLKLCLDIYMVRECGELRLEEDLFSQLIFLYRSPETLIKVTRRKVKAD